MSIADMIENGAMAAVITDPRQPDNPVIACNSAFERLTGYSAGEIVGRNCRILSGKATQPQLAREIEDAVRDRRPLMTIVDNFRKDGTPFRNALFIAPVFDSEGRLEYLVGSQAEINPAQQAVPIQRQTDMQARIRNLTPRQHQVLAAMVAGKRNKQIAYELGIGERTVKMHRAAAIAALDANSSADAIRLAVEAGMA